MYGMTPMGVFFTAIFPLEINEQALCQQPLFVPRSFVSPDGSCGYIPRRRLYFSMAGSGLSRVHRTAVYGGQPLTVCPGYAFSPASGGGISSRAAPFPKTGKGRGVWVELSY